MFQRINAVINNFSFKGKVCHCNAESSELGWRNGFKDPLLHGPGNISFYVFEPAARNEKFYSKLLKKHGSHSKGYNIIFSNNAVAEQPALLHNFSTLRDNGIHQHGGLGNNVSGLSEYDKKRMIHYLVNVTSLDTYFSNEMNQKSFHIDLVKIDTEGFDLAVILGMKLLMKNKKINFIIHECSNLMSR